MQKVVIITGASRGIGAATAREFAAAGWRVACLARSAAVEAVASEIGTAAMAINCDVADWASMQAAVQAVMGRWGRIDALVNNAGVIEPIGRLADADPAQWGRAIDINLTGVFHGMRAVIPQMRAQGHGTILTVSSGAASTPYEGWSAYSAGKAGVQMLTRSVHAEEAANGLRLIGLSPGTVRTQMQVEIKASGINPVSQLDPSVHVPPEWPAKCLLWMTTPAADPYLGQEIRLRDEGIRQAVGLIA